MEGPRERPRSAIENKAELNTHQTSHFEPSPHFEQSPCNTDIEKKGETCLLEQHEPLKKSTLEKPIDIEIDDKLNFVETTPDEISLIVTVCSLYGNEELMPRTILDTGAGRSYLIANKDIIEKLPVIRLENPWIVQFADNKKTTIYETLRAVVTVHSLDDEHSFQQETSLFVLRNEEREMKILMGRDLVKAFQIQLLGTDYATIQGCVIYEDEMSDYVTQRDDVFTMRSGTRDISIRFSLDDKDEDILFEFEDTEGEPIPLDEQDLDITLVEDVSAPRGRPLIKIPWTSSERPSTNFENCYARDKKIAKKLSDKEKQLYQAAVNQLIEGGYAVELPDTEPVKGHYIAVRPVIQEKRSSTKCRLCLDARDLNKLMRKGPQTGMTIVEALLSFRSSPEVATFDLSKAFWQVLLDREDQKYFSTVIMGRRLRFTRMVFGGNFSPSGLESSLKMILAKQNFIDQSEYGNYVDDFHVRDAASGLKLEQQVECLRAVLTDHGFPSDKLRFSHKSENANAEDPYLSYRWKTEEDVLKPKQFTNEKVEPGNIFNRRDLVSLIMSLYDPLGFRLRLQLAGRQLIRLCCEDNHHGDRSNPWKFPVSSEIQKQVNEWIAAAKETNEVEIIPRFVNCEMLYCFADASFNAWAFEVRGSDFNLLLAKGGLVKQNFTIPRAELTALHNAMLELDKLDLERLGVKKLVVLTDNEPTVHRLRNDAIDKRLKIYERNRIKMVRNKLKSLIKKLGSGNAWIQHIDGSSNLADYATRPLPLHLERPKFDSEKLLSTIWSPTAYKFDGEVKPDEREYMNNLDSLLYMTLRSTTRANRLTASTALLPEPEPPPEAEEIASNDLLPDNTLEEIPPTPPPADNSAGEESLPVIPVIPVDLNPRDALIQKLQLNQAHLEDEVKQKLQKNEDGLYVNQSRKITLTDSDPEFDSLRKQLLNDAHLPHHFGINATRYALSRYHWKGIATDVSQLVKSCDSCALLRIPRVIRSRVGEVPWSKTIETLGVGGICGIDICEMTQSGLDSYAGFLTVTCSVTKWVRCIPVRNLTAIEVCDRLSLLFNMSIYPRVIVTDNGSCFKAKTFSEFCGEHKILHLLSPSYASAYNGWIERPHQAILDQLRLLVIDHPSIPWTQLLPTAQFLINTRPYDFDDETGLCPIHLVYANSKVPTSVWEMEPIDQSVVDELKRIGLDHMMKDIPMRVQEVKEQMRLKRQSAIQKYLGIFEHKRDEIRERLKNMVKELPEGAFPIGSWVRVYRPPASKISPAYSEPRKIMGIPSQATRLVQKIDGKQTTEYIANLAPSTSLYNHAPSVL